MSIGLPDSTSQSMAERGAVSTSTNWPMHICSIVSANRWGCCLAAVVRCDIICDVIWARKEGGRERERG